MILSLHVFQALGKDVAEVTGEVGHSRGLLENVVGLPEEKLTLMEDTLGCLSQRLETLDSAVEHRCKTMRSRMQDLTAFQVQAIQVIAGGEPKYSVHQTFSCDIICFVIHRLNWSLSSLT